MSSFGVLQRVLRQVVLDALLLLPLLTRTTMLLLRTTLLLMTTTTLTTTLLLTTRTPQMTRLLQMALFWAVSRPSLAQRLECRTGTASGI